MLASPLPLSLLGLLLALTTQTSALPLDPLAERAGSQAATAWNDELFALGGGAPPVNFISYFPAITAPARGQVLREGDEVVFAWNGTAPPYDPREVAQTANITLGYISETSPGYHLDIKNPLATVQLYTGPYSVKVILPSNLVTRDSYLVILGSSANTSPLFTIEGTAFEEETPVSTIATGRQIEARPTTYVVGGETTVIGQPGPAPSTSITVVNVESSPTSTDAPAAASSASSTSVRLASQESASVSASAATARPTSAAGSIKSSQWAVAAIGGVMGLSLML